MTQEIPSPASPKSQEKAEQRHMSGGAPHAESNVDNLVSAAWGKQSSTAEATGSAVEKSGAAPAPKAEKAADKAGVAPKAEKATDSASSIHISDNLLSSAPASTIAPAGDSASMATPSEPADILEVPPVFSPPEAAAPDMPAPIQQAINSGAPIRFSSPAEDQAAQRQPDYFFTPEGKMVANPAATPSSDGSISVQMQSPDEKGNQSLREAITHENENQRMAAKDMIRLFQKAHPGQPVPSWMQDLADRKPNMPDFVPFKQTDNAPATPPPENGFANRGVGGGGGGGGGFAGNGGFDGKGYFHGNGGSGDGAIASGIGPGEQVAAKQLYDYFVEHGFTSAQASGILGNIQTESSFKTNAYNSGEGAIGLCQWEGSRRTDLQRFAASEGKPVTDWHVQADFIMHELTHKESGAFAALKRTETPEQAAKVFQSQYERSAALTNRAANASNIYHKFA